MTVNNVLLLSVAAIAIGVVKSKFSSGNQELEFSKSVATFSLKFGKEVVAAKPGSSVVFSAFSVEPLLAQLALGAEGVANTQIHNALGLPGDDFTQRAFPDVLRSLGDTKGVTLNLASKLFVREGEELNEDFKKKSVEVFKSEVQNLDFSKNVAAAQTINSWVAKNTNNKITDIAEADMFSSDTGLVLCNALYFKGTWEHKFDKALTKDRDFFSSSGKPKVQVPTMKTLHDFRFYDSDVLNAKILELPYEGNEANMIIVLPNEVNGITSLQAKIANGNVLAEEVSKLSSSKREVHVEIPKFKIETKIELMEVLKKLGIKNIFSMQNSGLTKLLKTPQQLFVSKAVQKAFIEVSEEGTEAAASNVFGGAFNSIPVLPQQFIANHPFLFYIKKDNLVLFSVFVAAGFAIPVLPQQFIANHPFLFYIKKDNLVLFSGVYSN